MDVISFCRDSSINETVLQRSLIRTLCVGDDCRGLAVIPLEIELCDYKRAASLGSRRPFGLLIGEGLKVELLGYQEHKMDGYWLQRDKSREC
ncbi:hypothetical protein Tco_0552948, partial [Tanacetum coccineum]